MHAAWVSYTSVMFHSDDITKPLSACITFLWLQSKDPGALEHYMKCQRRPETPEQLKSYTKQEGENMLLSKIELSISH